MSVSYTHLSSVIGGHGLLIGSAIGRKGIVSEGLGIGAVGILPGALLAIPLVTGKVDDVVSVVLARGLLVAVSRLGRGCLLYTSQRRHPRP